MRRLFALIGGSLMTLVLFALLALLVVPPESEIELREEIILELTEAAAPEAETPAESSASAAAPPPPPPVMAAPSPPAPAPNVESAIELPEPEIPPLEHQPILDSSLPELVETPPPPKPEPQPRPQPAPQPRPQPVSRPTPAPLSVPGTLGTASTDSSGAAAASNEPVDVGSSAHATHKEPPQYPSRALRRGLEGYVVVQFIINADGRVDRNSIQVIDASPQRTFERAAIDAIADWRFEPAKGLRRANQRLEFDLR